jgi:hypothetical protein
MAMLAVDLSKIKPFDVLLTSGGEKESTLIRIGQTMIRLNPAQYSHVAMFITPTLLIESSDAGIVFEQFSNTEPRASDAFVWGRHPRLQRLQSRLLIQEGNPPRLFGGLPKATRILVRRHKELCGLSKHRMRSLREKLLAGLGPLYLKAYPPYASFLSTFRQGAHLTEPVKSALSEVFGSVHNPGPFCSGLVAHLLDLIGLGGENVAASYAPIDFQTSNQFCNVTRGEEITQTNTKVPFAARIEKLLNVEGTPFLSPLIAHAGAIVDRIVRYERTGLKDLKGVTFRVPEIATQELSAVMEWCSSLSDGFWDWYREAPQCFATCPEKKRARTTAPVGSIVYKLATAKCEDIYRCSCFSLHKLEEAKQALIDKRISEFLKGQDLH